MGKKATPFFNPFRGGEGVLISKGERNLRPLRNCPEKGGGGKKRKKSFYSLGGRKRKKRRKNGCVPIVQIQEA